MIEITSIQKSYHKKKILEDVTIKVQEGECVGIVGCNGCGKTTLLSILAGAIKADKGSFHINDDEVFSNPRLFSKLIGYVPQENPLIEELTVFDNLKLWYCDIPEKLKKDLKEDGILTRFGVDKMIKTKVSKLSGGMKKRVSIGCALAKNPPILILDEPGAALDFVLKGEIIAYMKDYMKQGGTIFLTSHEQGELSVCNRMFFIKNGTSEEITSQLKSPDFFDWLTKQMENANET